MKKLVCQTDLSGILDRVGKLAPAGSLGQSEGVIIWQGQKARAARSRLEALTAPLSAGAM